jgi:hypothetical protein
MRKEGKQCAFTAHHSYPTSKFTTFTILTLVLVSPVSIASIFLGLWKNSGAL